MTTGRYPEIDEVIAYIHRHIYEPLSLNELASYAGYSPYHFTRIFKEKIGLSPLYFVSALRLQKAKDLLLHTKLSIRDIGLEIGQQSLGTFTTRFTERVGVTPSDFRNQALQADQHIRTLQHWNDWTSPHSAFNPYATVHGTIDAEIPFEGVILIGLFAKPIPEGLPLYGTLLASVGDFSFANVKPGIYYLMATSVSWGTQAKDILLPQTTLRARLKKPIVVEPFTAVPHQQLTLYGPRLDDPPILISLPLLMDRFLNRMFEHSNR
ncbi:MULTISPECIES: helix-turn-helix domain-containing protein [unclassified Paenibacillus]|uniref:helix-turn-helix domain-containing protein n=1 Tax=unclassified Paenibacillus TaxID=185978 RepID=UPI001C10FE0A|nr:MULTISPECIES: AraC family transcriptional regulator [unclassified Paenibacillus]MBU5443215.1 AraC family transcriptional regulator [Paenibacillus sp. MSJ-34]CAH0121385.1 HTH-type transcriptional activator RhaR [Paenibacillus sp. CECT 9249]